MPTDPPTDRAAVIRRMTFGDPDKPFHRPECECDACEGWRRAQGLETYAELRAELEKKGRVDD